MAASVIYYTAPDHYKMTISSTQKAAATGSDIHYLMDSNLDTFFQPTDSANQSIWIDTCPQDSGSYAAGRGKTSGSWTSFGVWLNNYDTDFSSTDAFFGSTYVDGENQSSPEQESWSHLGGPLWFVDLGTPLVKRYISIRFQSLPAIPKIGQLMVLKKYTLNRPNQYPISDVDEYFNDTSIGGAGTKHTYRSGKNPVKLFTRNYSQFFPADRLLVKNVFNDCDGSVNPFIMQEGTAVTDAFVCKMDVDVGDWSDEDFSFSKSKLTFSSLPYIRDGENY